MRRILIVTLVVAAVGGCSGEIGGPASPAWNGAGSANSGASSPASAVSNGSVNAPSNGSAAGGASGGPGSNGGPSGSGVDAGTGVGSSASGSSGGATGSTGGLPCDVQQLLATQCQSCHSSPPLAPAPMPLVTLANLMAPALADMTKNYAQMSVSRMQNPTLPMPPAPAARATAAQIATLQNWIAAGYPTGTCGVAAGGASVDGGTAAAGGGTAAAGGDAGSAPASPYNTPAVCTSMVSSTGSESATMRPGEACISCHSRGEGPAFKIAGTLYPSAHEPDDCHGVNGTTQGATVVIVDGSGATTTLTPNAVGNFSFSGALATPFQAKVVQGGKERIMVTPQTSGDCNSCHTETGANGAPGRIMLP